MKKNIFNKIFLGLSLIGFLGACSVEEGVDGVSTPKTFYSTELAAERGLAGVFGSYHKSVPNNGLFKDHLICGMGADDLTSVLSKPSYMQGDLYTPSEGNNTVAILWAGKYRAINAANEYIRDIEYMRDAVGTEAMSNDRYDHYIGNAKFIRARSYMDLCLFFNRMPLFETPAIETDYKNVTLSDQKDVLALVIKDLEDAAGLTPGIAAVQNVRDKKGDVDSKTIDSRATITACKAFLARAHMAIMGWPAEDTKIGSWEKVREYTGDIISAGVYGLLDDYAQNFGNIGKIFPGVGVQEWEGNKESVYSMIASASDDKLLYIRYMGKAWGEWEDYYVEHLFFDNMEDNYRKQFSVTNGKFHPYYGFIKYPFSLAKGKPTVMKFLWGSTLEADFRKYSGIAVRDTVTPTPASFGGFEHNYDNSSDIPVMRYAEVLLMYAEACGHVGDGAPMTGAEALNQVRRRAYAGGTPCKWNAIDEAIADPTNPLTTEYWRKGPSPVDLAVSGDELIKAVIRERGWEFLGELSMARWFDVTRLKMVVELMEARKADGREEGTLGDYNDPKTWRFPVPSDESAQNPNLKN